MKISYITALVALFFVGCAQHSHIVVGTKRPAINPEQVRVYITPPPKFEEVAVIDGTSRGSLALGTQSKMDSAMNAMKRDAASLGANGLLLRTSGDQAAGSIGSGFASGSAFGTTNGAYAYGSGFGSSAAVYAKAAQAIAIYVDPEAATDIAASPAATPTQPLSVSASRRHVRH